MGYIVCLLHTVNFGPRGYGRVVRERICDIPVGTIHILILLRQVSKEYTRQAGLLGLLHWSGHCIASSKCVAAPQP